MCNFNLINWEPNYKLKKSYIILVLKFILCSYFVPAPTPVYKCWQFDKERLGHDFAFGKSWNATGNVYRERPTNTYNCQRLPASKSKRPESKIVSNI